MYGDILKLDSLDLTFKKQTMKGTKQKLLLFKNIFDNKEGNE